MQNQILTCIIVDDEIGNTHILSNYVSQIPYLNLKMVFQKPTEALAYLLKNPTDLLITDIVMPQLSGIQLYECMVTEVNTKVIFISGYAEELVESLKYSVVDYLQKPVGFERFEQATQKALMIINFKEKSYKDIPSEVLTIALENYYSLGKMEKQILFLISGHNSTHTVAGILFISKKTVENHRGNIRKKLHLLPEHSLTGVGEFLWEKIRQIVPKIE